ncbi:glucose 1-dehydrogenase [Sphingomonas sp. YL-JM2C]
MSRELEGKVAIVTGGAKGIGRACAETLAAEGTKVMIANLGMEAGEEAAAAIRNAGHEAHATACDVADAEAVARVVDETMKRWGRLDFAINNAGTSPPPSSLLKLSISDWERLIAVNLSSIFFSMRAQIPAMMASGGGSIVNMASTTGLTGSLGLGGYSASKHGVIGLTKSAAMEFAAKGVRINAICPGAVATPLMDQNFPGEELQARMAARIPMRRMGRPEEIASLALWLCTTGASFTTGGIFTVDGGMIAG